ncbi:STN domain-containing protein [Variovorax sp. W2I14]|uniref:STN domain-containing protein n=1 Tax=Variovorax sp. W2I14 TaxID=3042290 RepID=UPI003D1FE4AE
MRANSASVSVLALAWCLAGAAVLLATGTAHSQPGPALLQAPTERIDFDIPVQRLGDAIDAYSAATRMDVLIDGRHAQRLSNAVKGQLSPWEAMELMLAGTGLQARLANATSVVIQPLRLAGEAAQPAAAEAAGMEESGFNGGEVLHQSYAAQVQQALRGTLCGSAQTRPGSYRLALRLRLDARGAVESFRLLSTTGEPARDAEVQRKVRTLSVGSAPPPSLPQPLVVLLLPEGPGAQADCGPAAYRTDAAMP